MVGMFSFCNKELKRQIKSKNKNLKKEAFYEPLDIAYPF